MRHFIWFVRFPNDRWLHKEVDCQVGPDGAQMQHFSKCSEFGKALRPGTRKPLWMGTPLSSEPWASLRPACLN